MTDAELVALQTSKSDWHARRARVILQGRAAKGTLGAQTRDDLLKMFRTDANPDWRLRAMWALHVTGGWTPDALIETLGDRDEHIRAWAVQLLSRGSVAGAEGHRDIRANGPRRPLAGRAALPGVCPAAPGPRRRAGASRESC